MVHGCLLRWVAVGVGERVVWFVARVVAQEGSFSRIQRPRGHCSADGRPAQFNHVAALAEHMTGREES